MQPTSPSPEPVVARPCFKIPIPEIAVAAHFLNFAVSAHLAGNPERAGQLIRCADMPELRVWTESLWGKSKPYVVRFVADAPPISKQREKLRNPGSALKALLHLRDGYRCRVCGVPVIREAVRNRLRRLYPVVARWGLKNSEQHTALQALGAHYDHLLPHSRGGGNEPNNLVVTCAPCNYARMHYTLEEVGLSDPFAREPIRSNWDGLERLLG